MYNITLVGPRGTRVRFSSEAPEVAGSDAMLQLSKWLQCKSFALGSDILNGFLGAIAEMRNYSDAGITMYCNQGKKLPA